MTESKVKFLVGNESIIGTSFRPKKSNGNGVLFFHGWGSSRNGYVDRAKALANLGYDCLIIDFRGFGESEGILAELSNSDHLDDAIAAYDFLKDNTKSSKISACGASYGGYLCAMLSGKRELFSIVMRVPGIYQDKIFQKKNYTQEKQLLDEICKFKKDKDFINSEAIKNIQSFEGYILIVGSTNDVKIPNRVVEAYYDSATNAAKRQLIWMDGAGHSLANSEYQKQYINILVDWFGSFLI